LKPIKTRSYVPKHLRNIIDNSGKKDGAGGNRKDKGKKTDNGGIQIPSANVTTNSTIISDADMQRKFSALEVGEGERIVSSNSANENRPSTPFVNALTLEAAPWKEGDTEDDEASFENEENNISWYENCVFIVAKEYVVDPVVNFVITKQEEFMFFHKHASNTHIVCIWGLWALMLIFVSEGCYAVFNDPDDYWWNHVFFPRTTPEKLSFIRQSYLISASAMASVGILFFGLEGTIVLLSWVCSWYIWYPLAMLSYTGYLLSILTCYTLFLYLLKWNK
jgi:hypothetical protein